MKTFSETAMPSFALSRPSAYTQHPRPHPPPTQAPEPQPQPALQGTPQRAGSPSNSPRQQLTPSSTTHRAVTSPAAPTQPSRYLHRPDHHNHSIPPPQHQPRLQTQGYQRPYREGLQYQKMSPSGKSSSGSHSTNPEPPIPDGEGCLLKRVDCWGVV